MTNNPPLGIAVMNSHMHRRAFHPLDPVHHPRDDRLGELKRRRNRRPALVERGVNWHVLDVRIVDDQLLVHSFREDEGVPKELLSDRVDVSVPVLDKHYDQRSEERKSRRRREVLEANVDQLRDD